jgi:hypothetical protein
MPKGKKICPKCNAELGVRTTQCSCGYNFGEAPQKVPKPLVAEPSKEPEAKPKDEPEAKVKAKKAKKVEEYELGYVPKTFPFIWAPAGKCPVKLSSFDEEALTNWAIDLQTVAKERHVRYSNHALVYWLRDFANINSKEFKEIKARLLDVLGED